MRLKPILYSLLKILLSLIQGIVVLFVLFLIYIAVTDYNPDKMTRLEIKSTDTPKEVSDSVFSFLIWNTGYAGLGAEMDFFYDGGKRVRPSRNEFQENRNGILHFIQSNDSIDFILLQEVDQYSKRSYGYNQAAAIKEKMPAFSSVFSKNYDVPFVPMPPTNPLGHVKAGMMTLSKPLPEKAIRMALPQVYSWPMKHFMLDRAAIITHHTVSDDKDLVVINIHNSAYVDDSVALAKEIAVIRDYAQTQYKSGNFVVIGGDWNQNPPGFDRTIQSTFDMLDYQLKQNTFGEKWKWVWDKSNPTNRSLDKPLRAGVDKTIIDFYAVSPNLKPKQVSVLSMDFHFSDHEPVYMRVSIDPPQKNQR